MTEVCVVCCEVGRETCSDESTLPSGFVEWWDFLCCQICAITVRECKGGGFLCHVLPSRAFLECGVTVVSESWSCC